MGTVITKTEISILGIRVGEAGSCGSFSGNSSNLLSHLAEKGICTEIVSTFPSISVTRLFQLLSIDLNLEKWKLKSKLDVRYYEYMSFLAKQQIRRLNLANFDVTLQIGAWYDVPAILKTLGKTEIPSCSYHDGNVVTMMSGPIEYPHLSAKYLQRIWQYEKDIYAKMRIIFAMSEWLKGSFIRDFGVPDEKVVVVGSGAFIPDYLICKEEKDYSIPNILFVGTDFRRKGGYVLLDAFSQVRNEINNVQLFIVGHKLDEDPVGVKSYGPISKNTPAGRNSFRKLYKKCNLFVLPSFYDPFPIAIIEAMANRIPCISTNTGSRPEVIQEGKCGFLVPVGDSRLLASKIIDILKNPMLAKEMGDQCRKRYLEHYTWDVVSDKVLDAIKSRFF